MTQQDVLPKDLQIIQSFFASYKRRHASWRHELFCVFENFFCIRDTGRRGNKITVKFLNFIAFQVFHDLYELSTKHKFSSYLNHHLHKLSSVDWPVLSRYHRYLLWTGWKSCQEKKNSIHLIMVQEMVQIIYFKISPWQSVISFRI